MVYLKTRVFLIFGIFALYFSEYFLAVGSSADSEWNTLRYLAIILQVGFFSSSTYFAGFHLAKFLGREQQSELFIPLGTALYTISALLFLSMGWAGPSFKYLYLCGCLLPFLQLGAVPSISCPKLSWLFIGVLFALALTPQGHPDPLYYHLLSLRRWYELRSMHYLPDQPLLLQTGLWEFAYFFPLQILSPAKGQNLIDLQIISQCLNLVLGFGGTFLLLQKILSKSSSSYSSLAIVSQSTLIATAIVAKNDWGILLWSFTAIHLFISFEKIPFTLMGLFLGLAATNKFMALLGILPLVFAIIIYLKSERSIWRFIVAFLIACSPIYMRNFIFTGYPFFPAFLPANSELLGETDKILFAMYSRLHISPLEIFQKFNKFVVENPLNFAFIGAAPFFFRAEKKLQALVLSCMASIFLGLLLLHPVLSWRLTGPTLLMPSLCLFLLLQEQTHSWLNHRKAALNFLIIIFVILGIRNINALFGQPAQIIRTFRGGDAMAWLRMNGIQDGIALGGNSELYYLDGHNAIDVDASVNYGPKLFELKSVKEIVGFLRTNGFSYFVETAGAVPSGRTAGFFASVGPDISGKSIEFYGNSGRVWNLKKLEALMREPSYKEVPHIFKGFDLSIQR